MQDSNKSQQVNFFMQKTQLNLAFRFGNSPEVVVILNDDTSRHTCSLVETNLGRLSTKCERKIVELLQSGLEVYQVVRKIRKEFSDPNDTNFVDYSKFLICV